jgi:hypothetical protein
VNQNVIVRRQIFKRLKLWEADTRRIAVRGQPGKKSREAPISTNKSWGWW